MIYLQIKFINVYSVLCIFIIFPFNLSNISKPKIPINNFGKIVIEKVGPGYKEVEEISSSAMKRKNLKSMPITSAVSPNPQEEEKKTKINNDPFISFDKFLDKALTDLINFLEQPKNNNGQQSNKNNNKDTSVKISVVGEPLETKGEFFNAYEYQDESLRLIKTELDKRRGRFGLKNPERRERKIKKIIRIIYVIIMFYIVMGIYLIILKIREKKKLENYKANNYKYSINENNMEEKERLKLK